MKSDRRFRVKTISGIGFLLTGIFSLIWFYGYNRFQIFYYQEQAQLFRFDVLYLSGFFRQPGGLIDYAGAFLTQFFYIQWLGALIYTLIGLALAWTFYKACSRSGDIDALFFIPIIPVALMLIISAGLHFRLSYSLGLLVACAAFLLYVGLKYPLRYVAGFLLFLVTYAVAGGNALVLTVLILLYELFGKKQAYTYPYLCVLLALTALIPCMAWRWIYVAPIKTAYFAMTAPCVPYPTLFTDLFWLSVPALYLLWRILNLSKTPWIEKHEGVLSGASCVLTAGLFVSVCSTYNKTSETINGMSYEVRHDHWDKVLEIGSQNKSSSRLITYFTNMALYETGRMADQLFLYPQFGTAGLFLDRSMTPYAVSFIGEVYYCLGMMPVAEQGTFEAMVSWSKQPKADALSRLVTTNMLRGDYGASSKYIRAFEHTLFYREWAKQQRVYLQHIKEDPTFVPPHTPGQAQYDNSFINFDTPDRTLTRLLEGDPNNKGAFEYLMAYNLLDRDVEGFKLLMDRYYDNFNYPSMPVSYEEALLVYENAGLGDQPYQISEATRKRFSKYLQYTKSSNDIRTIELLFGKTYWFYLQFTQPVSLQSTTDSNRY
ncbi:hypothetical protein FACS189415_2340 [Bacteroidia bacterium]|nr:hypothetical protein FACS189415_2340 [Bacteroidia bacterium]